MNYIIDQLDNITLYNTISLEFSYFRRYMDPLTNGDYPPSMRFLVGKRLPKFTNEESKLLKGSYDFIGVNYYSARYASAYPADYIIPKPPSYLTDAYVNVTSKYKLKTSSN